MRVRGQGAAAALPKLPCAGCLCPTIACRLLLLPLWRLLLPTRPPPATFPPSCCAAQGEYLKLQALYEDLKAAKIDEEVQQLLEQQNRHVTEHGQKAAQLVEHYKAEVGAGGVATCVLLVRGSTGGL